MISKTKAHRSYRSELAFLSVMTLVFGMACLYLGYLILPIAAGFYAALLAFEKKEGRACSYIIPLIPLVINVFVNGFCSLEAIAYVVVGTIIFLGFDQKKNKASVFFIASVALIFMMGVSLVLLAFDEFGFFEFSAVPDFYSNLYENLKLKFADQLTSITAKDDNGVLFYVYNASDAVELFNLIVFCLIPVIAIFSLITVGLCDKILRKRIAKFDSEDTRLVNWKFVTSPFISYTYVVFYVLSSFSSQGIVGTSLLIVSMILMSVYLYVGLVSIYGFISSKKGSKFAILSLIFIFVFFSSYAPQIVSLIGVFVNNAEYKRTNAADING